MELHSYGKAASTQCFGRLSSTTASRGGGSSIYKKALELKPRDPFIRCNAAINDELVGEHALMSSLEQSAEAHYSVGGQYLSMAQSKSSAATEPSPFYEAAIWEYWLAIDKDKMYHMALNDYAYTYWVFRLRWPKESLESLGPQFKKTLPEHFARKALHLAQVEQDDYREVIYGSTLAEVLMANGNPRLPWRPCGI